MSTALEKLGSIKISTPKFDLEGLLDSFGHLPKLLEGLTNGNPKGKPVEFETSFFNKEIDFGKGILNNDGVDLEGLAVAMGKVREIVGSGISASTGQSVSAQAAQRVRGGPGGASDTSNVQVVNAGGNTIGTPNVTNVTNNYVTNNYAAKVPANKTLTPSGHSN